MTADIPEDFMGRPRIVPVARLVTAMLTAPALMQPASADTAALLMGLIPLGAFAVMPRTGPAANRVAPTSPAAPRSATQLKEEFELRAIKGLNEQGLQTADDARKALSDMIGRGVVVLVTEGATPEKVAKAEENLDALVAAMVRNYHDRTALPSSASPARLGQSPTGEIFRLCPPPYWPFC